MEKRVLHGGLPKSTSLLCENKAWMRERSQEVWHTLRYRTAKRDLWMEPQQPAGLKSSSGKSVNFVIWVISELKNGVQINTATDQFSSLTLADNLTEVLLILSKSEKQRIYHTAGKSCIDRFTFTRKIAEIFELNSSIIKPVTSDMFEKSLKDLKKCCLDVSKAERELKMKFLKVEEGLTKMKGKCVMER